MKAEEAKPILIGVVGLQCGIKNIVEIVGMLYKIELKSRILNIFIPSSILSKTGHVKSCLNLPRPLGKPKY